MQQMLTGKVRLDSSLRYSLHIERSLRQAMWVPLLSPLTVRSFEKNPKGLLSIRKNVKLVGEDLFFYFSLYETLLVSLLARPCSIEGAFRGKELNCSLSLPIHL